jgi:membrane protein required for colicin V production
MSALDIVVLVIIAISALLAFARGMVRETLSLLGWIAAVIAVIFGLPLVRPLARQIISGESNEVFADIAAGVLIFIVVLVIVAVVAAKLAKQVKISSFGTLDRSLGLLFGLIRGFVLVCLLYVLILWAYRADNQPEWVRDARTRPALELGARFLVSLAPKGFIEISPPARQPEKKKTPETAVPKKAAPKKEAPPKKADGDDINRPKN